MSFLELRKIDVSENVKKKGQFTYLSWAYAVDELLQKDPKATWEFSEPKSFGDTLMVFCSVTAFGVTRNAHLAVMDMKNQAIKNPDAQAVNKAMQRCLTKGIALHGIALYLYQGEDMPEESDGAPTGLSEAVIKLLNNQVDQASNLDELKTAWDIGNKEYLNARQDNTEFKNLVNAKKAELKG
jgi:hypothetical protein